MTGPCPTPPEISPMSSAPDDMEWFDETALVVDDYGQGLVGFEEAAAQACVEDAGLIWRVVARDGEYFAVTADYSPQRLNAVIEGPVVVDISVG